MASVYRIGELAERIGRFVSTVRRWEKEWRVTSWRTPSGQRHFDDTDMRRVLQPGFNAEARRTVYAAIADTCPALAHEARRQGAELCGGR